MSAAAFGPTLLKLRAVLAKHAQGLEVTADTPERYCLEGVPGPATLQAWGGKLRRARLPVAWVEVGKAYVSYHVMGLDGNEPLRTKMSKGLGNRMQGKTCFNFRGEDEALIEELDDVTKQALAAMRKAGFLSS